MTWSMEVRSDAGSRRIRLRADEQPMSFDDLLRSWVEDEPFTAWYSRWLAGVSFPAFFWEHPPLTTARLGLPAEFMLLNAPALAGLAPDPRPFAEVFRRAPEGPVASFANLGGDALLVAPRPGSPTAGCAHLADFLRDSTPASIQAFWQSVARAVRQRLSNRQPLWLSTSGLGVAWLHARVDTVPKYYQHAPYRNWPPPGGESKLATKDRG